MKKLMRAWAPLLALGLATAVQAQPCPTSQ